MTISTAITTRQDVLAIPGYATSTTCNVVIVVRDTSGSEPTISFICNGVTYDNTDVVGGALTEYGGDYPAGAKNGPIWMGLIQVTGLSAFTEYSFTVADTTNNTSNTGTLRTAPAASDDFTVFFGTCYRNTKNSNPNGMFSYIKNYVAAGTGPPVAAYVHVDDVWYVADTEIIDTITNGTGLLSDATDPGNSTSNPGQSSFAYDWALGYACSLGMLGPISTDFAYSGIQYNIYASRGEDKIWCQKNLNFLAQWGDHEILNDVGWDTPYSGAGAATGAVPASTLWDAMFGQNGLGKGTSAQTLDVSARHWAATLGPLRIVAPDGISNATAATIPGTNTSNVAGPTDYNNPPSVTDANIYGDNQVLDILDALDTDDAFKLLLMDKGIKYPIELGGDGSGVFAEINTGEQHPIKNHATTMYSNFITKDEAHGTGQQSVMLNNKTNGAYGTTFVITGDHHNSTIYRNHAASPGAGDLAEEIVSINCGTMNNSGLHPYDSNLEVGTTTAQECTPLWLSGNPTGTGDGYWVVQLEVYGSRVPKECHVKIIDKNEDTVFHKKFIQYRGNFMYDPDTKVSYISGSIGESDSSE